MKVLGIETSGATASVALLDDGLLRARRENAELRTHAERLLHLVDACFEEAGFRRGDLDRVAVGIGPGSFTGLRVGIALAQGIGLGLQVDVVGVPSLAAMASQAGKASGGKNLCAIVDARRSEVFAAGYAPDGTELWPAQSFGLDAAASAIRILMPEGPFLGVGEMAERVLGTAHSLRGPGDHPDAEFVARLGSTLSAGADVTPLYARGANAVRPNLPPNPLASGSLEALRGQ